MTMRPERTPGHGPDCVCEWCFLAPPLPTMTESADALVEIAATLRRIERLLDRQATPPPPVKPPTPKAPTPKAQAPEQPPGLDFL